MESYPADHTIGGRVLELVIRQNQPVSLDWLCHRMVSRSRNVIKAVNGLMNRGWLIELVGETPAYQLNQQKMQEYLSSRPQWDDDEHREWMQHYRARLVKRLNEEVRRGRRTPHWHDGYGQR